MPAPTKERLNQIAERKLHALGVATSTTPDQDLVGELRTSAGTLPFVVVDHDKMRFSSNLLAGLGPVPFYDCPTIAAIEARLRKLVDERGAAANAAAARLRAVGVEAAVDPERLVAIGAVQAGSWRIELEGDARGVRVVRLGQGRALLDVPPEQAAIDLAPFRSRVDLDLHLASRAPEWERAARAAEATEIARRTTQTRMKPSTPSAAPDVVAGLVDVRASNEAPALGELVAKLGGLAVVNRLEVVQEYTLGAQRWRLVATHEAGPRFRCALYDPSSTRPKPIWEDVVDLARVGHVRDVVAWVLSGGPDAATAPQGPALEDVPEHLVPHAGEIWMMNVRVEHDDGATVHYVVVDVDGRPWGAARALPRPDFHALFSLHGAAHRMCILVDEVRGAEVLYRPLDAERRPNGEPRRLATAQLVATFVPEAGAY